MKEVEKVIDNWSKRKVINGKSFDELFKLDDIPLRQFYNRFFYPHVIPKPVNTFDFINKNRKINVKNKIKLFFGSKILRNYMWFNENRKIKYMKKIKQYDNKEKILFLTYSNHLLYNGDIFRIQTLIDEVKKDKSLNKFVLFVDPLSERNHKKISKFHNIYKYYDKELSKKAKKLSNYFFNKWKKIDKRTKYNLFKLDNKSLWPYLKYSFDFYFSKEFFYFLFLYYYIFKKILQKENINIVVLTGGNGFFEKCILIAAKKFVCLLF